MLSMTLLEDTPVMAARIAAWTSKDPVLAIVREFTPQGWPEDVDYDFQMYHRRKVELSVHQGCLVWGS